MSSMAIRIWIALNFLTVFFAVFFVAFLSTSLRQLCNVVQEVCNKGWKGCKGCLHIQNFCNHFAFWWRISRHLQRPQLFCRYSAISLPLLYFPAAPLPPSCTLPKCFIAASIYALIFGPSPIEGPATAAHLPNVAHSHTLTPIQTCSCNALRHQCRDGCGGWGVGTPTHSPLSYTQCTKLKMTKQNCENCENLLHRISALCCRADVARQQLQLHHALIPHSTLHVACSMPPGVGSRQHQAVRTWNHFLACWHCKILISILMSNCRLV